MHRVLVLFAFAMILRATASGGPAQNWDGYYYGPQHSLDWPAYSGPGSFGGGGPIGRTGAGDITGDGFNDGVVLDGAVVVVLPAPDMYRAMAELPTAADDFVVLPGTGLNGNAGIVVANGASLDLWFWSAARDEFQSIFIATSNSGGFAHLDTALVNGDENLDLVALEGDGLSLRSWRVAGTGPLGLVAGPSLSFSLPMEYGDSVDWNGNGTMEVALVTPTHLEVMTISGSVLFQAPLMGPVLGVAALRRKDRIRDRLLWIERQLASDVLYVADITGVEQPLDLLHNRASSMTTGNWDRVGGDEVVLLLEDQHDPLLLRNAWDFILPAPPTFSLQACCHMEFPVLDSPMPPTLPRPDPLLVDLNGDKDVDLLLPLLDANEIRIVRNNAGSQSDIALKVSAVEFRLPMGAPSGDLYIQLLAPTVLPLGVDDMEVVVWTQRSANYYTTRDAMLNGVIPMMTTMPPSFLIPIPESIPNFDTIYHIQARIVDVDSAGVATPVSSVYTAAFTMDEVTRNSLGRDPDAGNSLLVPLIGAGWGSLDDPQTPGGFVPMPKVTPFKEGDVPRGGVGG
ncbi:MAG: hypothetical protein QF724_04850 [Planctomycetota bacterium]|nr:hypothetical protein [Planctomycetota bacterium]MDP6519564.1 hypothetical protein [Planctomycetota bacterium]MDP6838246.1 hypothetical protein [Planctomycetota bacterium]